MKSLNFRSCANHSSSLDQTSPSVTLCTRIAAAASPGTKLREVRGVKLKCHQKCFTGDLPLLKQRRLHNLHTHDKKWKRSAHIKSYCNLLSTEQQKSLVCSAFYFERMHLQPYYSLYSGCFDDHTGSCSPDCLIVLRFCGHFVASIKLLFAFAFTCLYSW